jgi:hypothetical protein
VPALWGAALVGGTLLAFAILRLVRRPSSSPALLRVSIEPRFESRPLLPAIGGAVARLAVQRLLAARTPSQTADEVHAPLAPRAQERNGLSHGNGTSGNGRAKA